MFNKNEFILIILCIILIFIITTIPRPKKYKKGGYDNNTDPDGDGIPGSGLSSSESSLSKSVYKKN